jgi:polysaccharide biosynthesis/export protein
MNKCLCFFTLLSVALHAAPRNDEKPQQPVSITAQAAYTLGPADELSVHVVDLDDIGDKPVRIDPNGYIELPLIGRIHAAGLTAEQLRAAIRSQAARYIDSPQITINVMEYRSQPVSILGEVNSPGSHQLQGPTRLLNVISIAGGLKPDAGQNLTITRQRMQGTLALPGAHLDASGDYSIASVNLNKLLDGTNPSANIELRANDVISVSRADMVYVVGEVKKAGGITLKSDDAITITQALSLAEGTGPGAAPRKARILRAVDGKASNKNEVPVDLSMIMSGKAPDLELHPNDVLFVPDNVPASAMKRATEAAIQMATGVMIYRH